MTAGPAWSSSSPVGSESNGTLAAFQESLPVQVIATARSEFKTCVPDEALSAVVDRNRDDDFDYLPVVNSQVQGRKPLIGLLEVTNLGAEVAADWTVRDRMQPLGEDLLIGADASILTFVRDADRHPFRFVVSGHEINGLVGISDLQRLPVRAALFAIVTQIEMTMAEVIRRAFPDPDRWLCLLGPGRAAERCEGTLRGHRGRVASVHAVLGQGDDRREDHELPRQFGRGRFFEGNERCPVTP